MVNKKHLARQMHEIKELLDELTLAIPSLEGKDKLEAICRQKLYYNDYIHCLHINKIVCNNEEQKKIFIPYK